MWTGWKVIHWCARMAVVLVLHSTALTELGTLFAAVATRLGRGESLQREVFARGQKRIVLQLVRRGAAGLQDDLRVVLLVDSQGLFLSEHPLVADLLRHRGLH